VCFSTTESQKMLEKDKITAVREKEREKTVCIATAVNTGRDKKKISSTRWGGSGEKGRKKGQTLHTKI